MNILVTTEGGRAIMKIRAKDLYTSPVWNIHKEKCNKKVAYLDIVFKADEFGHLRTTIYDLAEEWGVSGQTVKNWLRYFNKIGVLSVSHDHGRLFWDISLVYEPLKPREKYPKKARECRYPYKDDCKGCEFNFSPELSDGGCKLMHHGISGQ